MRESWQFNMFFELANLIAVANVQHDRFTTKREHLVLLRLGQLSLVFVPSQSGQSRSTTSQTPLDGLNVAKVFTAATNMRGEFCVLADLAGFGFRGVGSMLVS